MPTGGRTQFTEQLSHCPEKNIYIYLFFSIGLGNYPPWHNNPTLQETSWHQIIMISQFFHVLFLELNPHFSQKWKFHISAKIEHEKLGERNISEIVVKWRG